MPGLTILQTLGSPGEVRPGSSDLEGMLAAVLHDDSYLTSCHWRKGGLQVASTAYEAYPVDRIENTSILLLLEGRVYGPDGVHLGNRLLDLAAGLLTPQELPEPRATQELSRWLCDADGDFVLFGVDKNSGRWFLCNDVLARLPVYHRSMDGLAVLSREPLVTMVAGDTPAPDRMGVAQQLLFGYPLGNRTLFAGISILEPATLVTGSARGLVMQPLHVFNYDNKTRAGYSTAANGAHLVEHFVEASRLRGADTDVPVVSLSGGLDSRAVGSALHRLGKPFVAATYLDSDRTAWCMQDVRVARELAERYGVDWRLFELDTVKGAEPLDLLRRTGGQNVLRMSFLLPFLDGVRRAWGPGLHYFTGDGGDKVLPDLRPEKNLRSMTDLVEYVLERNALLPPGDVLRMLDIPGAVLRDELARHLDAYPERDLARKYTHFLIHERGIRWLFAGEDRNRSFFWSTTPFYAQPFFRQCMECPDGQKAGFALYREFLRILDPKVAAVDNANWRFPITSPRLRFKLLARRLYHSLPPGLAAGLKRLRQPAPAPRIRNGVGVQPETLLRMQLDSTVGFRRLVSGPGFESLIDHTKPADQLYLLTISSCLELVETGRTRWDPAVPYPFLG
jgi:asparagine synthase (glutamine-hydrolysing)